MAFSILIYIFTKYTPPPAGSNLSLLERFFLSFFCFFSMTRHIFLYWLTCLHILSQVCTLSLSNQLKNLSIFYERNKISERMKSKQDKGVFQTWIWAWPCFEQTTIYLLTLGCILSTTISPKSCFRSCILHNLVIHFS